MSKETRYRVHVFMNQEQCDRFKKVYSDSENVLGSNDRAITHESILKEWMALFQETHFGPESLRELKMVNVKGDVSFAEDPRTHECIFCGEVKPLFSPSPNGALCLECGMHHTTMMVRLNDELIKKFDRLERRGRLS